MRFQGNDFVLEVPDDWQDRSIISFAAAVAASEFAPNVVVTKEAIDPTTSIEDYAHRQFSVTQSEVPGLSIIEQQNIQLNSKPAVQIVQKISAHGLHLQQLQTFILAGAEIYIVTCTAAAANFQQHFPRFKKIAESLHLTGK